MDNLRLLEFLKENHATPIIALAMSEIGLASRILVAKMGSLFTYAAPSAEGGTAPGQIAAKLMLGKKLAERLVLELKDKLDDFAAAPVPAAVRGAAVEDVLSALTNLGYQRPAAEKAIQHAVEKEAALAADFDGLFRAALKVIR